MSSRIVTQAFAAASRIVFPAAMQRELYAPLLTEAGVVSSADAAGPQAKPPRKATPGTAAGSAAAGSAVASALLESCGSEDDMSTLLGDTEDDSDWEGTMLEEESNSTEPPASAASVRRPPSPAATETSQGTDKVRVIYNGVPLARLDKFAASHERSTVRAGMGYSASDVVVLHLGSVCPRKAQLSTARAFTAIRRQPNMGHVKLLMVGARYIRQHEIDYLDEIKAELAAAPRDVQRDATILDIQKDVAKFYHAADIVLVPSLNEVLPCVLTEAMAFQKPVVASAIDGIVEAVSHGAEGYLIRAGNVDDLTQYVASLADDAELRARMGAAGRRRILKQFSYTTMCKAYASLLQDVALAAHGAASANREGEVMPASSGLGSPAASLHPSCSAGNLQRNPGTPSGLASGPGARTSPVSTSVVSAASYGTDDVSPNRFDRPVRGPISGDMPAFVAALAPPSSPSTWAAASEQWHLPQAPAAGTVVLVDMDSTVVDFDGAFLDRWVAARPASAQADVQRVRARQHYELERNFDEADRGAVISAIATPGLYAAMKPYPGALAGLRALVAAGYDVRLVTAPHPTCAATCAAEKFGWVQQYLGPDWVSRLILARDKTHIRGDILIDDKPAVVGSARPVWQHVLFSQPWNARVASTPAECAEPHAARPADSAAAPRLRVSAWTPRQFAPLLAAVNAAK